MAEVILTQGYVAIVDDEDLPLISGYRWKVLKSKNKRYAARSVGRTGRTELMHRVIARAPTGVGVDHIDGDGLNNRRGNLRLATQKQNAANMQKTRGVSRFKGVYWNKKDSRWQAQISNEAGGVRYLGQFRDETDAARAYNSAAIEQFGAFANLNAIESAQ